MKIINKIDNIKSMSRIAYILSCSYIPVPCLLSIILSKCSDNIRNRMNVSHSCSLNEGIDEVCIKQLFR